MKSKLITSRFIFITSAILIASVSRLFPHLPNFTPIAAMALFGAINLKDKRIAFILPLLAMFVSDVIIEVTTGFGFHNTMVYVYISFILTSFVGFFVKRNINFFTLLAGSIISSILFFIITNFGVWAASGFQLGVAGLSTTYILGIPFFAPTLLGDLCFNAVLFGSFYLAQIKFPALQRVN